jgi:outer membrane receptor protein involved in Fe transport
MNHNAFRISLLAGAALGAAIVTPAFAQVSSPGAAPGTQTEESADNAVEAVVVTGSRVILNGVQAPTPLTVVGAQQLLAAAPANLADGLNQLPLFKGSTGTTTGGAAGISQNSGNFLNLRNLGVARTLVLLDGRRATPTSTTGATDINLLPQSLVKRVDVVTGGASAAYGSDAVAGVVNFVLDTDFKGVSAEVQGGLSDRSDAKNYKFSITGGTDLAGGRAHVVASAQHFEQGGLTYDDRSWSAAGPGLISPLGAPAYIRDRNVNIAISSFGGLITAGPMAGTQFLPGGVTQPFDFGTLRVGNSQVGGSGARGNSNLAAKLRTENLFVHAKYDLTDRVQLFIEGGYSESENTYPQTYNSTQNTSQTTIYADNAYLPADVKARMATLNLASFTMGRVNREFGSVTSNVLNRGFNVTGGFRADLGGDWNLSGYVEHGQNRARSYTRNDVMHEHMYAATDAVRGPGGDIVCRVTLTNPGLYPGCVPINLFGEGAPSQAAINYVAGTTYFAVQTQQDVASLAVRGKPFSTWAGPVGVAFGSEYRRVEATVTSDPLAQATIRGTGIRGYPAQYANIVGSYYVANVAPVKGEYDIREVFAETVVPLAKDAPFAKSLEFNGAVRYTDYSTSGGVTTWKLGLSYQPVDDLRFRLTKSKDIRAANVIELFTGSQFTQGPISKDPLTGWSGQVLVTSTGNRNLKPENADTLTAGVVYTPSWLSGLSASVDYYKIDIDDAIGSLSAQQTVEQCAVGSAVACGLIDRNPDRSIIRVTTPRLNLTLQRTYGVDFELGYAMPMSRLNENWGGRLNLRALATYVGRMETTTPGSIPQDRSGEVGKSSNPRWSGVFSAIYSNGPFSLYAQERLIGPGSYDETWRSGREIVDNNIAAVLYTDVTARYRFRVRNSDLEAFLSVNNLFDKTPPIMPMGGYGLWIPTNMGLYDILGRRYTMGVKAKF